jgi:mannose-6-phosphate isomerase-like protein (cupin superfamily)
MPQKIFSIVFAGCLGTGLFAQGAATPGQTAPAPAPARRAAPGPATMTLTIQVTDTLGSPLAGTQVVVQGPVAREGVTTQDGSIRLASLRAGTYRLRLAHEGSITLEREQTLRAGESLSINVALSAAPPPPKAPEPVKLVVNETPGRGPLPPPGEPRVVPVPLFLEKNFIGGREGRKESSLGCTATSTATLFQLREAWLNHAHDDADEWIYVVAGEGTLRVANSDQKIQPGTFASVPHTVSHALVPQGRNPLIVISVLAGPACKG